MKNLIKNKIRKFNSIASLLESKGYKIQGCSGFDFSKCYFSSGTGPDTKRCGYIDNNTLDVMYEEV